MYKPKVISLFSGAGGLDYGFEAAGFSTAAAVELDHDCCETLRANRRWTVIERNIFDVPTREILEVADSVPGNIDLVIGGPPCQPFSKAGYWARGDALRLNDPRSDTLNAYLRVVDEARPRAILLENVRGLAFANKDEGLQLLLDGFKRINKRTNSNYQPVVATLNAADYGVPQIRERVFVVASREGLPFRFPEAQFGLEQSAAKALFPAPSLEPYRTAWDAIGDVVPNSNEDLEVRGKWAPLLSSIPEGANYLWHTDRGGGRPLFGWRRRFWTFLLKLAKDRPSWTIQAQPGPAIGPFHWKNRRLSMRELCRLQTFPDDVVIRGTHASVQKQLGNAVPSLLAEALARSIRFQLLGMSEQRGNLKLLPPLRRPIPRPERRGVIPREFLALEGNHAAHPGTGLGYGASLRAFES